MKSTRNEEREKLGHRNLGNGKRFRFALSLTVWLAGVAVFII